jgi:hypothetical protein
VVTGSHSHRGCRTTYILPLRRAIFAGAPQAYRQTPRRRLQRESAIGGSPLALAALAAESDEIFEVLNRGWYDQHQHRAILLDAHPDLTEEILDCLILSTLIKWMVREGYTFGDVDDR